MSQGRISYSRVSFVGTIVLAISGSGFVAGRLSDGFEPSPSRVVKQKAEALEPAALEPAALEPSDLEPSDLEPAVRNDMTLALRNLVTIVAHPGNVTERAKSISTVTKSDLSEVARKNAGTMLALRNAFTIIRPLAKTHPVSTVGKSDYFVVDREIARMQLALRNVRSIVPSLKNYERVAVVEKNDVSAGISEFSSDLDKPVDTPLKVFSSNFGPSLLPPASLFLSPAETLWSKFGQPVWYVQPGDTGLRIERPEKSENEKVSTFFGGLTEREFRTREVRCLAKAIYHEARGESQKGQFAVAQTIMNRVRAEFFPDTICGVIYENSHRKNKCQFSFACDGVSDKPKDLKLWNVALDNAREVANGKVWLDDIGYASHYHATYVRPNWRKYMNRIKRIGIHIFYRAKFMPLPEELALRMPKNDKKAN